VRVFSIRICRTIRDTRGRVSFNDDPSRRTTTSTRDDHDISMQLKVAYVPCTHCRSLPASICRQTNLTCAIAVARHMPSVLFLQIGQDPGSLVLGSRQFRLGVAGWSLPPPPLLDLILGDFVAALLVAKCAILPAKRPEKGPKKGPNFDPFCTPAMQSPGGVGGLRPLPSSYCAISGPRIVRSSRPHTSRPPRHRVAKSARLPEVVRKRRGAVCE